LRLEESSLGNFIADAMRQILKTEISFITAGSISSDKIHPKEITMGTLMTLFPWGGFFVSKKVTGKNIVKACERSVEGLPLDYGYFAQISGFSFVCCPSDPIGKRIRSVLINGIPVDPDRGYTMATTQFISEGGDGYDFSAGETIISPERGILVIDSISNYIKKNFAGKIVLKCEGRISFV